MLNFLQLFRRFTRFIFAAVLAASSVAALAQTWPAKPVRIISPYGAGGANDISIRIITKEIETKYSHRFIVENKPGAGTRIANEATARAPADGYTFMWAAAPLAITAAAGIKTPYDIHKDFVAFGPRVIAPIFLTVNASSPVHTVADFVRMARDKKDGVTFASPGSGSAPHLTAELFGIKGQFKVTNVHYRGDATAYTDLVGGRVDAALTAVTSALPFVRSGKLRVIAVASESRSPVFPDAPTFAEGGTPDVVGYGWYGFVAPAGTAPAIVQQLGEETTKVLLDPAIVQQLVALGLEPQASANTQFAAFIDSEMQKWSSVIKTAGITLD
jgi:tripartite-type tricarboxylate transporter receptor subunit TctC